MMLKIESLVTSVGNGVALEPDVAHWLTTIKAPLRKKLEAYGLIGESGEPSKEMTLGQFLDSYINRRSDVKPGTLINWSHTRRNLLTFFGPDKLLTDITAGDASDFERFLKSGARVSRYVEAEPDDSLSAATIRKRCQNAKQFFEAAVDHELIGKNPFAKIKSAMQSNRERDFFITREMYSKILEACPDREWRLIVTLSRIGGVRCPSEIMPLRWDDIDWAGNRMTIHSPKTEHHAGKGSRVIPIFSELRAELDAAFFALGDEPSEFIINRYRDPRQNLRTQFTKIIKRAGLEPWQKLFANMRASRATELADLFPGRVCSSWMGHTEQIARKHYQQVTQEHFERAISSQ
ncbi:MAG: phage integrase SAM-like domain-containing protein, partial [Proteobacteria bacterium]|nr:phage integrase SAM-like domain-containing protein [Pseudomonadota bacterium]